MVKRCGSLLYSFQSVFPITLKECFVASECFQSECFLIAFIMSQLCDLVRVFMCVLRVGSRPSAHRNMTFSTSIKAGSHSAGPCSPPSATQMFQTKTGLCEQHTTRSRSPSLSYPLILSDTLDVSQSEGALPDPAPSFFSPVHFFNGLLLMLLLCLQCVHPFSCPVVITTGKPSSKLLFQS